MSNLKTLSALFLTCALVACGGGGGGSDTTTNPVTPPPPAPVAKITNFNASGAQPTETKAVASGESIVLNWSALNADSCTLTGGTTASVGAYGQQVVTAPSVTAATTVNFSLVCGTSPVSIASIKVLPARTLIVDAGLQQALQAQGLTVASDGSIDTAAALAVTTLIINQNYGITDLSGLSSFQALTKLQVQQNPGLVNVADVSSLTNLQWLSIWKGKFTSIDVSALTDLTLLGINEIDGLATVDISKLTKLVELDFQNDNDDLASPWGLTKGMTSLDISHNTALQRVYIGFNLLTSIDTSKNGALQEAWFEGNPFQSLDLSANHSLSYVVLYQCSQLASLNLTGIANGGLPARLSLYSDPMLTSVKVASPSAYTTWLASATATPETEKDGSTDTMYQQGSITMWLPTGLVFTQ
jgi:Leucine-rich repeat (LRR) protein